VRQACGRHGFAWLGLPYAGRFDRVVWLIRHVAVYFYVPGEANGEFSNFARFGIERDGLWWPTVEHYFQAQKFLDAAYRERIRSCGTPKKAAELGRSRKVTLRADWERVKEQVMERAVLRKFQTHAQLAAKLLATGDEPLVESAPGDYFWGCGQDGSGLNRLGCILERVRSRLRESS